MPMCKYSAIKREGSSAMCRLDGSWSADQTAVGRRPQGGPCMTTRREAVRYDPRRLSSPQRHLKIACLHFAWLGFNYRDQRIVPRQPIVSKRDELSSHDCQEKRIVHAGLGGDEKMKDAVQTLFSVLTCAANLKPL
jgi:hypothetical protein